MPVFWACVTDAVGFGALKSASVGPVGDFGVMMSISCIAVLISVWLVVPLLSTFGQADSVNLLAQRSKNRLRAALHRFAGYTERHGRLLGTASLAIVIGSLIGLRFLEVETDQQLL